jgi:hypothetical protein
MAQAVYASGQDIQPGDHVRLDGEEGRVEFVAVAGDAATQWYVEQCGEGCMLLTPNLGRVYVAFDNQDLEFVSRGDPASVAPQ